MAEEAAAPAEGGEGGEEQEAPHKCEVCVPGLPAWMATFSDLVTLLLTFFVLLLSFAKTESAKYEAALGSIRNAFGGNVLKQGEVIQRGKSPDNSPTMLEAQEPVKPFPIEFLTMEGILDKHEINRNSEETMDQMKEDLAAFGLGENVDIYEMNEGVKVFIKDKIFFQKGKTTPVPGGLSVEVLAKLIKMLSDNPWQLYILGHASRGEVGEKGQDALILSGERAMEVAKSIMSRGVSPDQVTISSFGDTRTLEELPDNDNRRVEFMIRKRSIQTKGKKTDAL